MKIIETGLRIPEDIYQVLRKQAFNERRSLNFVIVEALKKQIKKDEWWGDKAVKGNLIVE